MMEIVHKLTEAMKTSGLPLLLFTFFHSSKILNIKEKGLINKDEAPGDNFPYIVMDQDFHDH